MSAEPRSPSTRRRSHASSQRLGLAARAQSAINIEALEPDAFDRDDVILLSTLANQITAALRVAELLERLKAAEGANVRAPHRAA